MVAWCARWGAQEERAGGAVLQTLGTARVEDTSVLCMVGAVLSLAWDRAVTAAAAAATFILVCFGR